MRDPGKYTVIVDTSGCEHWQPVTRKDPRTLADYWNPNGRPTYAEFWQELERQGLLTCDHLHINARWFAGLILTLKRNKCIPDLSIQKLHKLFNQECRLTFGHRAVQGDRDTIEAEEFFAQIFFSKCEGMRRADQVNSRYL